MRVVIVGGGVAGPALALALLKTGKSFEITIIEATEPNFEIGTYFTLQDNGVNALRTIGAYERVAEAGFPTKASVLLNDRSVALALINFGQSITVRRSRTNQILMEMARDKGCKTLYRQRVVEVKEAADPADPAPLTVILESGMTIECELLVGADGVRSAVRQMIDPRAPAAGSYIGLVNHAGEGPVPEGVTIEPDRWHMLFGKNAFFLYTLTKWNTVVWGINEPRPFVTREERASTSAEAWRQHLIQLFEGDVGPMQAILRVTKMDLNGDNTCDMKHVAKWWRGRMVLMGDAIHAPAPSSGQGGSMALEDALTLAMALRDYTDVNDAFRAYENNRRSRVQAIVAQGARMSQSKMPGAMGRRVRDVFMPLVFRLVDFEKQGAWITQHRIEWDSTLPLDGPPTAKSSTTTTKTISTLAAVGTALAVVAVLVRRQL
jgi:2-polyprenyl-6-methoxyphenol hydroxylase-like FAD-dependent oxidoreductase